MSEAFPQLPQDGKVCFFKRDREQFRFLSNFASSPIELDGQLWPTVEHYYQAMKSLDPVYRSAILAAKSPGEVKRLGTSPELPRKRSRHSWFRLHDQQFREDWGSIRLDVMRSALIAKFTQNQDLQERLVRTFPADLIEDSLLDNFWGTGPEGTGTNWLGRLLVEVRDRWTYSN